MKSKKFLLLMFLFSFVTGASISPESLKWLGDLELIARQKNLVKVMAQLKDSAVRARATDGPPPNDMADLISSWPIVIEGLREGELPRPPDFWDSPGMTEREKEIQRNLKIQVFDSQSRQLPTRKLDPAMSLVVTGGAKGWKGSVIVHKVDRSMCEMLVKAFLEQGQVRQKQGKEWYESVEINGAVLRIPPHIGFNKIPQGLNSSEEIRLKCAAIKVDAPGEMAWRGL